MKLPPKYELSRKVLTMAAQRGPLAFRTAVQALYEQCRPPFQVLNSTGSMLPSALQEPDGCLWGNPIDVKYSFKYPSSALLPSVAFSDQMTSKIANDPLIPPTLDDMTPENWESAFSAMCAYQLEADATVRALC